MDRFHPDRFHPGDDFLTIMAGDARERRMARRRRAVATMRDVCALLAVIGFVTSFMVWSYGLTYRGAGDSGSLVTLSTPTTGWR